MRYSRPATLLRRVSISGVIAIAMLAALASAWITLPGSAQVLGVRSASATIIFQEISAKALTDHECNSDEWHFVINQIDVEADAPLSIHVEWANGNSEDVPLEKFTGGVAHYTTTSNLDSTVTSATAQIYILWDGQFNLSHGPCAQDTPTSTDTATETPTDTATDTATDTPTDTATETATDTPVDTETATATEVGSVTVTVGDVTEVPSETPSDTPTDTATVDDTEVAGVTQVPDATVADTEVPAATSTSATTTLPNTGAGADDSNGLTTGAVALILAVLALIGLTISISISNRSSRSRGR